jgi:serine-threonine kinase receptor-associated protein
MLSAQDKNRFCYGGEDMWVYLCDYTTGEKLETLRGHHGPVHSVKFAPGGETFASGSEDGTIRLWKTETPEEDGVCT